MKKENINIHKNLKIIGLVAKNGENIAVIEEFFASRGIEILVEKNSAKKIGKKGFSLDEICKKTNFIISLGGDGTLISTCRQVVGKDVYVLGIHDGTLGFLTDIKMNDMQSFFTQFFAGIYEIERPLMLDVVFKKNGGKNIKRVAFNDVVITRNTISSMSKVDTYLNGKYFNTYYGDGVIVSSPAGSTAYNMSANGPIIYPLSNVFCITPICSHSLTQRPLVLPNEHELSFKNVDENEVAIVIDGQDVFDMNKFDEVCIHLGNTHANLIRHLNRDYFSVLKEKLHWGHNGGKA
ncbi:NAD(+) kinase [Campylobacter geochelonis]|uniref:NAD kinase n=1 Tax=Campylobacter geochelonis TaxID=1780362 RepID=A0A128EKV5_9BACT|nr:NAD(+) kinase [Campylobacter geochelonis]CZE49226.1 inorganic polyphosphate/ATP-NAD kinase [Campylobacter geochelonis]CZE49247.1 inorganic polyphosphate/ATP-NAD kinase [Campylobacter geochelonis]CZE51301.1 inorganic polyphosphate/ATP-NAD kinase [Campylobacter geochelonis]